MNDSTIIGVVSGLDGLDPSFRDDPDFKEVVTWEEVVDEN